MTPEHTNRLLLGKSLPVHLLQNFTLPSQQGHRSFTAGLWMVIVCG